MVTAHNSTSSRKWPRVGQADLAASPLLVFYETTQSCDLVCQHCRACAQAKPDPRELTPAQSRQLIDQLAEFPTPPHLVLTGGDPLKRADLFQLVEYARTKNLEVSITPSATPLVTTQAIRRLRDAGVARMAISIDGADAETHDAMRGVAGSFDRSLEILADAQALGMSTQINTTLGPHNIEQIEPMANLFAELDITMWSVFFLVPVGRAKLMPRLSADQCEAAFSQLWSEVQRQPYLIKTTEAPHFRRFVAQQQTSKAEPRMKVAPAKIYKPLGVNDGKGIMFVGHTGMVFPSGFLPILCGVVPQQHAVEIYQQSAVFRGLRDADQLKGKCQVCEFRNVCGGSRARAYAVAGDMLAQEPDCAYVPNAWVESDQAVLA